MTKTQPYQHVRRHILERLSSGEWEVGDRIPSEVNLARELSVHRLTVNRAMGDLVREGRLERRRGVGTIVRTPGRDAVAPGIGRGLVGILTGHGFDVPTNPYFGVIFEQMRRDLQTEDIYLVPLGEARAFVKQVRRQAMPVAESLNALVLLGPVGGGVLADLDALGFPMVVAGFTEYEGPHASVAGDDGRDAARIAGKLMTEAGHRLVVHLNARPPLRLVSRLEGFLRGSEEQGHALPFRYVVEADGLEVRDGRNAMMEFLERGLPFTAVFGGCDNLAIGALGALQEFGVKVPGEVSVVGFDGIDNDHHHHLPLATMAVPRCKIASRAAELVVEIFRTGHESEGNPIRELLPSEWVPGETLAPASNGKAAARIAPKRRHKALSAAQAVA
jgi:GntR family transcriptional regulator, arabinose operon transcriptional repressor